MKPAAIIFPAEFGAVVEVSPALWRKHGVRKEIRRVLEEQAFKTVEYHGRVPIVGTWEIFERGPHDITVFADDGKAVVGSRRMATAEWRMWLI